MMEMTGLRVLHASMKRLPVDIQQFRFRAGVAEFDCLFLVNGHRVRDDRKPYLLTLTSRGRDPQFFAFPLDEKYRFNTYLGERYADLRNLLYVDGRAREPLIPNIFFQALNQAVPTVAYLRAVPTPVEIVRLRHDLEDRDRPYFNTWGTRGKEGPSEKNRAKTLAILGPEALDFSIEINKSSIWSVTETGRDWRQRSMAA